MTKACHYLIFACLPETKWKRPSVISFILGKRSMCVCVWGGCFSFVCFFLFVFGRDFLPCGNSSIRIFYWKMDWFVCLFFVYIQKDFNSEMLLFCLWKLQSWPGQKKQVPKVPWLDPLRLPLMTPERAMTSGQ